MTNLSALEVAKLTAALLGTPVRRAASKSEAVTRFLKVANEKSIPNADTILNQSFDNAMLSVNTAKGIDFIGNGLAPVVVDHSASNALIANFMQTEEGRELDERIKFVNETRASRRAALEIAPEEKQMTPGLARLRANKNAEAIRAETAAEADAATKVKPVKKPTAPKAKPQVDKAEVAAPARTRLAAEAKIVSVVENPKKQGSRSHARFALYRAGQTTEDFVKACVAAGFPEKEARADLSWDRRKGFIKIEA